MSDAIWREAFLAHWGPTAATTAAHRDDGVDGWRGRFRHVIALVREEFLKRPKAALLAWQEAGLVPPSDPAGLAAFLHAQHALLDPVQLGDWLSDQSMVPVFGAWMAQLGPSFCGLSIEASLRLFLMLFALPGEAPKLDRLMERKRAAGFEPPTRKPDA
eukprot:1768462-Prymnesium_polylepis.1